MRNTEGKNDPQQDGAYHVLFVHRCDMEMLPKRLRTSGELKNLE
jgi:hypothetical protein